MVQKSPLNVRRILKHLREIFGRKIDDGPTIRYRPCPIPIIGHDKHDEPGPYLVRLFAHDSYLEDPDWFRPCHKHTHGFLQPVLVQKTRIQVESIANFWPLIPY